MPLNLKPSWKPIVDEQLLTNIVNIGKNEEFYENINRIRYEKDPLRYRPTATCRTSSPNKDHHVIRFEGILADFIFRLGDKTTLDDDDLSQNPNLIGTIHFIRCLLDGY